MPAFSSEASTASLLPAKLAVPPEVVTRAKAPQASKKVELLRVAKLASLEEASPSLSVRRETDDPSCPGP